MMSKGNIFEADKVAAPVSLYGASSYAQINFIAANTVGKEI